ncbi:MAG: hypothetical protein AAB491_00530 [Patescibacteria group bacterium]
MKTAFKKIIISVAITPMITTLILPSVVFAQRIQNNNIKRDTAFCLKISDTLTNIENRTDEREAKIKERIGARQSNIDERREKRDDRLAEFRQKRDENRNEHFQKLMEKAQTDAQKQAVIQFQIDINNAITARKTAIDKAISDFRQSIDNAISSRKVSVDSLVSTYKNSIKEDFNKAKTDCDNGVATSEIRTTLRASLKGLREKFENDRKNLDKVNDSIDSLITAKKAAFEKAISDFKTAVQAAKEKLKAAFPES